MTQLDPNAGYPPEPPNPPDPNADRPGFAQCEVTGKWAPEDELIFLHGKRVSAEGKQWWLEQLQAGEAVPGELVRPSVLRRIGCAILDSIILGVVGCVLGAGSMGLAMAGGGLDAEFVQAVAGVIAALITMAYLTIMHGALGQTLGKMAGRIRVVRMDGAPIDYSIAFSRMLWYYGPSALGAVVGLAQTWWLTASIAGAAAIYWLVNIIIALTDSDMQRGIHDRMAGTRVIYQE